MSIIIALVLLGFSWYGVIKFDDYEQKHVGK
jgi:hypothetical protein